MSKLFGSLQGALRAASLTAARASALDGNQVFAGVVGGSEGKYTLTLEPVAMTGAHSHPKGTLAVVVPGQILIAQCGKKLPKAAKPANAKAGPKVVAKAKAAKAVAPAKGAEKKSANPQPAAAPKVIFSPAPKPSAKTKVRATAKR